MFDHNESQVMTCAPTITRGNVAVIVDTSNFKYPSDAWKDGAGVYKYTGTKTSIVTVRGVKFKVKVGYAKLKAYPSFCRIEYWLPGIFSKR